MRIFTKLAMVCILATCAVSVGHAKCKWTIKGKLKWSGTNKPLGKVQLRISAKEKNMPWSSVRWPNPTTKANGYFYGKSGTILATCKKKRSIRIELKYQNKWVEVARKTGVVGTKKGATVNFGLLKLDPSKVVKKAGCRLVDVNLTIQIGEKAAGPGVLIALTEQKLSKRAHKRWKPFPITKTVPPKNNRLFMGKTDKDSTIRGRFLDCSNAAKKKKSRQVHIAFRGEWHGKRQKITIPKSARLIGRIVLPGPYMTPRPKPTIRFRLPVENPHIIKSRKTKGVILTGPLTMDHDLRDFVSKRPKTGFAYDYRGNRTLFGTSYPGHEGTDFMLRNEWSQMDKPSGNHVVAAADGEIIKYRDGFFDRCGYAVKIGRTLVEFQKRTSLLFNLLYKSGVLRNDKGKAGCTGKTSNKVVIRHMGKGKRSGQLYTHYIHLKKGSVIAALKKLGVPESQLKTGKMVKLSPPVKIECGSRIGRIGSSGISIRPHLHFAVTKKISGDKDPQYVDPYKGKLSTYSYWVKQNGANALPSIKCQLRK